MHSSLLINRFIKLLAVALIILVAGPGVSALATQPGEEAQIRLQYASFDPLGGEPDLPAAQQLEAPAGQHAMSLVQFSGPVLPEWKAAVEAAGAHLYDYIPDYAFLTRLDGPTAEALRALPFVRWVGSYHPAYRLPTSLASQGAAGESSQGLLELNVQALPDADLEVLTAQVSALGGSVQAQSAGELASLLRVALPGGQAQSLAALDGVVWVEPYLPMTILNDVGNQVMSVPSLRTKLNLFGSGQVVAVADTGLDIGVTTSEMSDDFEGRILEGQAICKDFIGGRTTWSDLHGHGTHVSGSVLGNGTLSGGQFAGVAPQASIVFQSIDDDAYDPYGNLECIPLNLKDNLFKPAYDKNARLHSNSWGGPTGDTSNPYGGYDDESRLADDAAWTYKNMLLLFAAGNSGVDTNADGLIDSDSIGSPGTAKNVLTVGATENNRPAVSTTYGDWWGSNYPSAPISSDPISNNTEGMAAFSSRGPTDDGRIKPDLVAPGTMIVSARSHVAGTTTGWGVYDENYLYMGGTSMATPLTAGAAALVREWLTEARGFSNPSAALMKAALINGASNLSPGQYVSPQEIPAQRPNNVSGWGRVNLQESIDPAAPRQVWLQDNTAGLSTGSKANFTINVGTGQSAAEASLETVDYGSASELLPAPESTPQPPVSEEPRDQLVELVLDRQDTDLADTNMPQSPDADVNLVLDDGSYEWLYGFGDIVNDKSYQFIWLNRFTPAAGEYPFNLEEIWVLFDGAGGIQAGDDIDLVVYQDSDTNPANGATLLKVINQTVLNDDGTNWSKYSLIPPLQISGPGDVLIGVINRYAVNGATPFHYPAAYDEDNIQNRSWRGWWSSNPPLSPPLPPDDFFEIKSDGNWLIRGYGSTAAAPTPTPSPTPPPTTGGPLRLTLAWTDWPGSSAAARALVNDLDLEVVAPDGKHYYGNFGLYSSGQCLRQVTASIKWDQCNNVEGITIPNAPYGNYTVFVHGYNVPNGPQPFALVASGDYLLTKAKLDKKLYLPFMRR